MGVRRRAYRPLRSLLSAFLGVCGCGTATVHGQQFSITQWTHKDGLPSTSLYAIQQTRDGFLWLGTADGLFRYDGYQFERKSLNSAGLRSLGEVRTLLSAGDSVLYAGTATGMVVRLRGSEILSRNFGAPIADLQQGPSGTIALTAGQRRILLHSASLVSLEVREQSSPALASGVNASLGVPAETVSPSAAHLHTSSRVVKTLTDKRGNTWFATLEDGLYLRRGASQFEHFSSRNGLSSDRIRDIAEDRESNIWVATDDGLDRLRADKFAVLTRENGLRAGTPKHLAAGMDGTLWIGSADGLEAFDGRRSTLVLPKHRIDALTAQGGGPALALSDTKLYRATLAGADRLPSAPAQLLAGTSDAAWLYSNVSGLTFRSAGAAPKHLTLPAFAPATVTCMAASSFREPLTVVWLGLSNGNVVRRTGSPVTEQESSRILSTSDGLSGAAISFIAPGPDGTAWISTENGLAFFDGYRLLHWDTTTGLPGDHLLWAVGDRNGNLWIAYNFGIAQISIADLMSHPNSPRRSYQIYDEADGLKGNPSASGSAPVALTADGRLWFTMSRGLAVIALAHIQRNTLPSPVHILTVTAEGKDIPVEDRVTLAPLNRTLQITYAGLSLAEPRKVQYRYRLDGFDSAWQDVGPRHSAFYTNLPPGTYLFRVIASNSDGVWNSDGASIAIRIRPAFYQTGLFRAACLALAGIVLFLLLRLRLRQSAANLRYAYEARMAERSRIAQDLHDNLIQEMLGVSLQLEIADSATPAYNAASKPIARALSLVQRAIAQGRFALQQLRQEPISPRVLEQALRDTAEARRDGSSAQLLFTFTGEPRDLRPESGEDILQILREAVRNAIEHARGTPIHIDAHYTRDRLALSVRDGGAGIPPSVLQAATPGHYGITGMRERAAHIGATLTLDTSPETGTSWHLIVPATLAYIPRSKQPRHQGSASPAVLDEEPSRKIGSSL